jgi:geranylgeranyl reductase family protein
MAIWKFGDLVIESACDVAIVGAGPAGAWAAHLLASRGARVIIFDHAHPREKPCGGGVTARALSLVRPTIDLRGLALVAVERAVFRDGAGRTVDVPLPSRGGPGLVVASRTDFDARLLDAAVGSGARYLKARVTNVARDGRAFLLDTVNGAYRASQIIGADGANSLVRRRLARTFTRPQLSIATGFFARGVTSRAIVLEMIDEPAGYLWSFPRPDHLAIGICAQADSAATSASLRARAARWILDAGLAPRAVLVPYAWPIPSLSADDLASLDAAGEGWLLVGDAAGLVDPITREGIFFALDSARLAAESVAGGRMPHRAYVDQLHAGPLDELARAARFKRRFFQPRFTRLLLDALQASAAVREVMADLVAGTQSYRGLKWRLAKTLEAGLAWRALAG